MLLANSKTFRLDVQILRAFAVLLVILFHSHIPGFSGGFLGVDIFFVVSGFWMSNILIKELSNNTFSFVSFYERRLRRIIPALYVTLLITFIVGWFELWPRDFDTMSEVMGSAVLFLANAVIKNQDDDYFQPELDTHSLLHIWSLSLEEQFYLIFPLVLFFVFRAPNFASKIFVVLLPITSFYSAFYFYESAPSTAFYHLPARLWEFWLGYLAACWRSSNKKDIKLIYTLSVLTLVVSVFIADPSSMVPGLGSIVPAIATAIILALGGKPINSQSLKKILAPLVWLGGVSYSLYLVHQPLLAFLRLRGIIEPFVLFMVTLVAGVGLSFILKRFVEDPFRNDKIVKPKYFWVSFVSFGAIIFSLAWWGNATNGIPSRFSGVEESITASANGSPLRGKCHDREVINACTHFDANPTVVTLGDSHSVALSYAVGETLRASGRSVLHLSVSGCGFYTKYERCQKWYRDAIDRIVGDQNIKTVVISMRIAAQFNGSHQDVWPEVPQKKSMAEKEATKKRYIEVFDELLRAGKKIIWVLQVPEVGPILESQMRQAVASPDASAASVSIEWWNNRMRDVLDFVSKLDKRIMVFDPKALFCGAEQCFAIKDGITLYRDRDHMSLSGARLISAEIKDFL